MKRNTRWLVASAIALFLPQLAMANGGYTQTVGLANLLSAKLGSTTSSSSYKAPSSAPVTQAPTISGPEVLPTKTLPTQTQTVVQEFVQPVIQPIQTVIQPVVNTVIQPVYSTVVANPVYNAPTYAQPIHLGTSGYNLTSMNLMAGNPYVGGGVSTGKSGSVWPGSSSKSSVWPSGMSKSVWPGKSMTSVWPSKSGSSASFAGTKGFSGHSFGGYSSGSKSFSGSSFGGYSSGAKSFGGHSFGGGKSFFGGGGFSSGPTYQSFSVGAGKSFAFGGAAFAGSAGSVSINVGNGAVTLPGFSSLGIPSPGETLQQVYNYNASFQSGGVNYTVEVSSRLTANFAAPSASPSSVRSI